MIAKETTPVANAPGSLNRRRAVVLLIVITLLALFAAVALGFVYYSNSEAIASQNNRDANTMRKPDVDPELLMSQILEQLLWERGGMALPANVPFDPNVFSPTTPSGPKSSLYGQGLIRNLIGYRPTLVQMPPPPFGPQIPSGYYNGANPNATIFNGPGKIGPPIMLFGGTGFQKQFNVSDIVNLAWCEADGKIFDPERIWTSWANLRSDPTQPPSNTSPGPYVGWNVPYNYPDTNNLFLGAINANGEVLAGSFFRTWNPNISMDPASPLFANWTKPDPYWKYLTMRPHPSVHPFFPLPQSGGGDVLNFDGGPGLKNPNGGYYPQDSIWIDIGLPIMTGPDGRKYKPLVALLIASLDGKCNLNIHGNNRGNGVSVSNLGMTPGEINPSKIASSPGEFANVFLGVPGTSGRYGPAGTPGVLGYSAANFPAANSALFQSFIDADASQFNPATNTYTRSAKYLFPGENGNANPSWFTFPNPNPNAPTTVSYGTPGTPALNSANEYLNHFNLYNYFNPGWNGSSNIRFPASDTEALLRYQGTGSPALSSTFFRLLSKSLADPSGHNRRAVTTIGNHDFVAAGPFPWLAQPVSPTFNNYGLTGPATYPTGPAMSYPPNPNSGEFGKGWDFNKNLLKRLNLNRKLTDYPAPSSSGRITDMATYTNAVNDRTAFANDIFTLFVQVTMGGLPGGGLPSPPSGPGDPAYPGYQALLWLAQLSVNIVDFIDTDNYVTPWNWNPNDPTNGWVYGTELPRLVINEAYAEVDNDPRDPAMDPVNGNLYAAHPYHMDTWVELLNPLQQDPAIVDTISTQLGAVRLEMPDTTLGAGDHYAIYQLLINDNAGASFTDNQLGTPARGTHNTDVANFSGTPGVTDLVLPAGTSYSGTPGSNQGFYVLGPTNNVNAATVTTPTLQAGKMTYRINNGTNPPNVNNNFFLQRLACPDLPPQTSKNGPTPYNPFITVDYVAGIPSFNNVQWNPMGPIMPAPVPATFTSFGKVQPYAGLHNASPTNQVVAQTPSPANAGPQHTFFRHNAVEGTPPLNPAGNTLTIPFNWLVHPDRQMTSPLEILHVSAYAPYQLTQQFMGTTSFGHESKPAWLDGQSRLYRAFEFLDVGIYPGALDGSGNPAPMNDVYGNPLVNYSDGNRKFVTGGRCAGKIDLNNVWDKKVFRAWCDAQPGLSTFNQNDVDAVFNLLMQSRSPLGVPGPADLPFKGMAAGNVPAGGMFQNATNGIGDTFLRAISPTNSAPLFNNPLGAAPNFPLSNNPTCPTGGPPNISHLQTELMNKLFNNATTRSNVFAVWMTVGFFDTTDGPVTQLVSQISPTQVTVSANQSNTVGIAPTAPCPQWPNVPQGSILGVPWAIQPGSCIWIDNEAMNVTNVTGPANGPFTLTFLNPLTNSHQPGAPVSLKGILGAEVGASEGRQTRHRMFAIVDRTALSLPSQLGTPAGPTTTVASSANPSGRIPATPFPPPPPSQPIPPLSSINFSPNAMPPSIITGNTPPSYTGSQPDPYLVYTNQPVTTISGGVLPYKNVTVTVTPGNATGLTPSLSPDPKFGPNVVINGSASSFGTLNFTVSVTDSAVDPITMMPAPNMASQNFTLVVYQPFEVDVSQIQGVSPLNFPTPPPPGNPPKGPSMNINYAWAFKQGLQLQISDPNNPGAQEQFSVMFVNQSRANTITGLFYNTTGYGPGTVFNLPGQPGAVPGSILANPGPQVHFDHRQNTALIPHYSIIE